MIIEIGTSDFRTQAGQVDGVFIEPVKYYYDRMRGLALDRSSTAGIVSGGELIETHKGTGAISHFENVAISDYEGDCSVWYVSRETMERYKLPSWVAGCSTMYGFHQSVAKTIQDRRLEFKDVYTEQTTKVIRIKSIIDKYNITSLDLLKIDTEGHDCIILNDYLNTVEILPKVIQFESNELSDPKEVAKVVSRLKPLGYDCKQVRFDMICKLR
ncbi:MAG: hypothetical protein GQ553_00980 [Nitrosomonadaceae bacterium]|nr:hypothetical protein [Nitrosomonadaceae bacterium]